MNDSSIKLYFAADDFLADERCFLYYYEKVSDYRKQKIDRLSSLEDKRLSLLAGLLLEYALNKNGETSEKILIDKEGKPYLKNGALHFNLSHSKNVAVLAVSRSSQVGCDVEKVKKIDLKIAKRYFSEEEVNRIFVCEKESERIDSFFRLWTLKESFVKAIGKGLAIPLNSFSIDIDDFSKSRGVGIERFFFKELEVEEGYKCAVCLGRQAEIQLERVAFDNFQELFG